MRARVTGQVFPLATVLSPTAIVYYSRRRSKWWLLKDSSMEEKQSSAGETSRETGMSQPTPLPLLSPATEVHPFFIALVQVLLCGQKRTSQITMRVMFI